MFKPVSEITKLEWFLIVVLSISFVSTVLKGLSNFDLFDAVFWFFAVNLICYHFVANPFFKTDGYRIFLGGTMIVALISIVTEFLMRV